MSPVALISLRLDDAPLVAYLLGAIIDLGEAFLEDKFGREEI